MEATRCQLLVVLVALLGLSSMTEAGTYGYQTKSDRVTCKIPGSKCFGKTVTCPDQCPNLKPDDPTKVCFVDCTSPKCEPECRRQIPNCNGMGAACYDPRFIGGDNIIFYFHGKSNEHYTLLSDTDLQINARFIGHRPVDRSRDYTWIQAIGIIYGSHNFTLEAAQAKKWNNEIDHLSFTYDGQALELPKGQYSEFKSSQNDMVVLRTATKNSVTVTITGMLELSINVVPITKTEDKIHNYHIPNNDSFTHLEVQFRFFNLSPKVEGILGRTYQPDFVNPAKPGVEIPVVGGEDKYWTSSLLSSNCLYCVFKNDMPKEVPSLVEYGMMDCKSGPKHGYGIVCKK